MGSTYVHWRRSRRAWVLAATRARANTKTALMCFIIVIEGCVEFQSKVGERGTREGLKEMALMQVNIRGNAT